MSSVRIGPSAPNSSISGAVRCVAMLGVCAPRDHSRGAHFGSLIHLRHMIACGAMTRPSWLLILGICLASVAAVVSCVGDSGTPSGGGPGTLGGPCLQNGTCNAGLACAIVGSAALCTQPDASIDGAVADAGADHNSGDAAPGVDASDAAPPCEAGITTPPFSCPQYYNDCYDVDSMAHVCQASSTGCMNMYTNFFIANCFATCGANQPCCLSPASATPGCPGTLSIAARASSACTTTGSCAVGEIALCTPSQPCITGKCVPAKVAGVPALQGTVFGFCQ